MAALFCFIRLNRVAMKNLRPLLFALGILTSTAVAYGQRTVWILSGVYAEKNGSIELRKHSDIHNTLVSFSTDSAFVLSLPKGEHAFPYHVKKDVLYFGVDKEWKPVGRFVNNETLLFFDRNRDVNQYKKAKAVQNDMTNEQIRNALRNKTYTIHYADLFQEQASNAGNDKLTFGPADEGTHDNGDVFYIGIESFGKAHYLFIDYRGGYFFQVREITDQAIILISTFKEEHDVVLQRVLVK